MPGLQLYNRAFVDGRVGEACAIAVVLSVLVFIVDGRHRPHRLEGVASDHRSERIFAYAFLTLFSVIALYPVVGALLLALHPRDAPVSGSQLPWPMHFETFKEAWNIAHLSTYLRSSLIVSTARRDRHDGALHPRRVRLRDDAFRGKTGSST